MYDLKSRHAINIGKVINRIPDDIFRNSLFTTSDIGGY
jgi:hypothetical protein